MNNLTEVFENSKENMFFKELDFFKKLTDKEKKSLFYPGLIINVAQYTGYPDKDAKELALLAQMLFYSIEIHEKILEANEVNNLVILEGDHLYSKVFQKITRSVHIENISKFTNYMKNFCEKRIMYLDGLITENKVTEYKYKQISKLVMEIIAEGNNDIMLTALELSSLYIVYLKNESIFPDEKKNLLNKFKEKDEKVFDLVKKIVDSMEGVASEY
ncbi:MAG: hypothetical protein EOM04_01160 [Clostridia bacterium]|nr:hypothetical protein [Clostridia bacterium]